MHLFTITVYTNRNSISLFLLDVNKKVTENCGINNECVVVVNLNTTSKICEDSFCLKARNNN